MMTAKQRCALLLWWAVACSTTFWPCVDAQWTNLWQYTTGFNEPSKRAAHSMVVYDDALYIFGGFGSTSSNSNESEFDDTWKYNLNNRTWTRIVVASNTRPSKRFHHSAVLRPPTSSTTAAEMYIFGGISIASSISSQSPDDGALIRQNNEVWHLQLDGNPANWSCDFDPSVQPSVRAPIQRSEAASVLHNDQMWLFGGITYESSPHGDPLDYADFWSFDLDTKVWKEILPSNRVVPPRRFSHSATLLQIDGKDFMVVTGGRQLTESSWQLLDDVWLFSFEDMMWTEATHSVSVPRIYTSTVAVDKSMWLFGGYFRPLYATSGYVYDDIVCADFAPDQSVSSPSFQVEYSQGYFGVDLDSSVPPSRYNHRMVAWNKSLVMFGGSFQDQRGDLWMLKLEFIQKGVYIAPQDGTLGVNLTTMAYVLASFITTVSIVLLCLILHWRRTDRRNRRLAMRASANHGVAQERLNQLKIVKYKRAGPPKDETLAAADKNDDVCPICLIEFENDENVRYLPCNHFFHVACVDEWLKRNTLCPMCKRNVEHGRPDGRGTTEEASTPDTAPSSPESAFDSVTEVPAIELSVHSSRISRSSITPLPLEFDEQSSERGSPVESTTH